MPPEPLGFSARSVRLRLAYRRRWTWALLGSILLHGLLVASFRRQQVWPRPTEAAALGYPGPMKLLDLAPLPEVLDRQQSLARERQTSGALVSRDLEVEELPQRDARPDDRPRGTPSRERTAPDAAPEPVVFELQENWSTRPSSPEAAQTEQFQILKLVRPEYPEEAIRAWAQGRVKLRVRVGVSGRVEEVDVIESPGNRFLERAAVDAMRLWEFRPYTIGENAVPFTVYVPFRYRLVE